MHLFLEDMQKLIVIFPNKDVSTYIYVHDSNAFAIRLTQNVTVK